MVTPHDIFSGILVTKLKSKLFFFSKQHETHEYSEFKKIKIKKNLAYVFKLKYFV